MSSLISIFSFKNTKFLDFLLADKVELFPVSEMLVLYVSGCKVGERMKCNYFIFL